jgi:hypothetical protein
MWHSAIGCLVTLTLGLLTAPLAADAQPAGMVCVPDVTSPTDSAKARPGTAVVIVRNPAMDIELHTYALQGQLRDGIEVVNYSGGDVAVQIQPGGGGPQADSFFLVNGASTSFTPPTGGVQFWVVTVRLFCAES